MAAPHLMAQVKREPLVKKYSYAAQKKYYPELINNVFLGMTWNEFRKAVKTEDLEFERNFAGTSVTFKAHFPVGNNFDNISSVTYNFPGSDSTYDAGTMDSNARLYEMAVEFERVEDLNIFLVGWRQIKGPKILSYYDWIVKTNDGMECRVAAGGFSMTYVGKIPGTPWKEDIELIDAHSK